MPFLELRNIYKTYYIGDIDVPVLKGISMSVSQGEIVSFM